MSRPATSRLKVNPVLGSPPTLEWRPVTELGVDPVYQRSTAAEASKTLIRRIAQFWDWGLCQPLAVAKRPDGSLMVVDGQHRLEAARLRGDIQHLPCVITAYANEGDEAAAFVALNQQRKPLTKLDLFKAALAAEDEVCTAIAEAMTTCGLRLAAHSNFTCWKPGDISNIAGVQRVWQEKGKAVAEPALRAISLGFEGAVLRYAGTIFPGIARFLAAVPEARSGEGFDRLIAALRRQDQLGWRAAIMRVTGEGKRRDIAGHEVIGGAYAREHAGGGAPLPTALEPSDLAWCAQCDQRVSGMKAAACTSPFCSVKAKAA